ncbi:MAG: TlpA disulfide reductase family protein [Candidatus Omnitrophota bacterium]
MPRKGAIFLSTVLIFLVLGLTNMALAQDIILDELNAKPVNFSGYKGKPAMLFFWTTWCTYCRQEIKTLNQMSPQLSKEGITVFAVNVGESDYIVRRFINKNMIMLRVLLDKNSAAAYHYELIGVPTYIILDKTGSVIWHGNIFPTDYKKLFKEKNEKIP